MTKHVDIELEKAFSDYRKRTLDKLDHYDFGSNPYEACQEFKEAVEEAFKAGWKEALEKDIDKI